MVTRSTKSKLRENACGNGKDLQSGDHDALDFRFERRMLTVKATKRADWDQEPLMTEFKLVERLAQDTAAVASLTLSELRLAADARFPWLMLVPRRPDVAEIIDLAPADRAIVFNEIIMVSEVLKAVTGCDKLNVAALGNIVRQLHIHVIARFAGDAVWPDPVWSAGEPVAYEPESRDRLIRRIRDALPD
jgi:diadenosine tetraphosphate (Ap4A) HIT family hydrolase